MSLRRRSSLPRPKPIQVWSDDEDRDRMLQALLSPKGFEQLPELTLSSLYNLRTSRYLLSQRNNRPENATNFDFSCVGCCGANELRAGSFATKNDPRGKVFTFDQVDNIKDEEQPSLEPIDNGVSYNLPRGGSVFRTRVGNIQFGMPPETIKDHLGLGLPVPSIFVVPQDRFDKKMGINVAEFEFPAYYNFFIKKQRIKLIVNEETEACVRTVFQETLLGPKDEHLDYDTFADEKAEEARPVFRKELDWFARNPKQAGTTFTVDSLIEFIRFRSVRKTPRQRRQSVAFGTSGADKQDKAANLILSTMEANLGNGVKLEMSCTNTSTTYKVFEDNTCLGVVEDHIQLPPLATCIMRVNVEPFQPPAFGVTFLGTSHGFDPYGSTTGFVIWIGHRGVIVDPPPNSSDLLRLRGIPGRLITNILLTHCHADHDAGTFQKILEDEKTTVITTPTIIASFLRKYSALAGLPETFLSKLFTYRPICLGRKIPVLGAEFRLFYSLHSIPCIGFEVFYQGKSMVYSGDTYMDPEGIEDLYKRDILTTGRKTALLNFPFQYDLVLHECGVPPIHTPVSFLASLSDSIKENLYLVHVSPESVPPDSGLKLAREGVENTITIKVEEQHKLSQAALVIDALKHVSFLSDIPVAKISDVLSYMSIQEFKAGCNLPLAVEGHLKSVYIILKGFLKSEETGQLFTSGDCIGKEALPDLLVPREALKTSARLHASKRQSLDKVQQAASTPAPFTCLQNVECLAIEAQDLAVFLRDSEVSCVLQAPAPELSQAIKSNLFLSNLTEQQTQYFMSMLLRTEVATGDMLWRKGQKINAAYLVATAELVSTYFSGGVEVHKECGALLCEGLEHIDDTPSTYHLSTLEVSGSGVVYTIPLNSLQFFLKKYPGLMIFSSNQ